MCLRRTRPQAKLVVYMCAFWQGEEYNEFGVLHTSTVATKRFAQFIASRLAWRSLPPEGRVVDKEPEPVDEQHRHHPHVHHEHRPPVSMHDLSDALAALQEQMKMLREEMLEVRLKEGSSLANENNQFQNKQARLLMEADDSIAPLGTSMALAPPRGWLQELEA